MVCLYEHVHYDTITLLQMIPKLTGVEELSRGGQATVSACKTI